jgi:hypothetical protein
MATRPADANVANLKLSTLLTSMAFYGPQRDNLDKRQKATTAQRLAMQYLPKGLIVYDTDDNLHYVYKPAGSKAVDMLYGSAGFPADSYSALQTRDEDWRDLGHATQGFPPFDEEVFTDSYDDKTIGRSERVPKQWSVAQTKYVARNPTPTVSQLRDLYPNLPTLLRDYFEIPQGSPYSFSTSNMAINTGTKGPSVEKMDTGAALHCYVAKFHVFDKLGNRFDPGLIKNSTAGASSAYITDFYNRTAAADGKDVYVLPGHEIASSTTNPLLAYANTTTTSVKNQTLINKFKELRYSAASSFLHNRSAAPYQIWVKCSTLMVTTNYFSNILPVNDTTDTTLHTSLSTALPTSANDGDVVALSWTLIKTLLSESETSTPDNYSLPHTPLSYDHLNSTSSMISTAFELTTDNKVVSTAPFIKISANGVNYMWVNVQAPYETFPGNGVHFTAEAFRLNRGALIGGPMWYPYRVPDGTHWEYKKTADSATGYVEIKDSAFLDLKPHFPVTTAQSSSGITKEFDADDLKGLAGAQSPVDDTTDGSHWIAIDAVPTAAQGRFYKGAAQVEGTYVYLGNYTEITHPTAEQMFGATKVDPNTYYQGFGTYFMPGMLHDKHFIPTTHGKWVATAPAAGNVQQPVAGDAILQEYRSKDYTSNTSLPETKAVGFFKDTYASNGSKTTPVVSSLEFFTLDHPVSPDSDTSYSVPIFNKLTRLDNQEGHDPFTLSTTDTFLDSLKIQSYATNSATKVEETVVPTNDTSYRPYPRDYQYFIGAIGLPYDGLQLLHDVNSTSQPKVKRIGANFQFADNGTLTYYKADENSEYTLDGVVNRRTSVDGPHKTGAAYNSYPSDITYSINAFAPIWIISRQPGTSNYLNVPFYWRLRQPGESSSTIIAGGNDLMLTDSIPNIKAWFANTLLYTSGQDSDQIHNIQKEIIDGLHVVNLSPISNYYNEMLNVKEGDYIRKTIGGSDGSIVYLRPMHSNTYSMCLPTEEASPYVKNHPDYASTSDKYAENKTVATDPKKKLINFNTVANLELTKTRTFDGSSNWYDVWGQHNDSNNAGKGKVSPEFDAADAYTSVSVSRSNYAEYVTNGFGAPSNYLNFKTWAALSTPFGNNTDDAHPDWEKGITIYVAFHPLSRSVLLPTYTATPSDALDSIVSIQAPSAPSAGATSITWATTSWDRDAKATNNELRGQWKASFYEAGSLNTPHISTDALNSVHTSTTPNKMNYILLEFDAWVLDNPDLAYQQDGPMPAYNVRQLYKIVYRPKGAAS